MSLTDAKTQINRELAKRKLRQHTHAHNSKMKQGVKKVL